MKTRAISAAIMLAIFIPLLVIGGLPFSILVFLLAILALKEMIDMKETKKKLPCFIKIISYVFLVLMMAVNASSTLTTLKMDYRVISGLFLTFLIPSLLYHDRKKYSINDAFYLISTIFFISLTMNLLIYVRTSSINLLIYLFLVTIMTDTYAYLTGKLVGKTKLLEEVSPNKTWEGTIGGTVFGVFISTMFYITVINPEINIFVIVAIGLFLSIIGQFGDLFFSSIKRYYNQKDFSNLIPGHGGILDRLDSILFVILGVMFFITIL